MEGWIRRHPLWKHRIPRQTLGPAPGPIPLDMVREYLRDREIPMCIAQLSVRCNRFSLQAEFLRASKQMSMGIVLIKYASLESLHAIHSEQVVARDL